MSAETLTKNAVQEFHLWDSPRHCVQTFLSTSLTANITSRKHVSEHIHEYVKGSSMEDGEMNPVPEIIDPVFAKTSQNARFLLSENERFGLVFVKTGSINSGTGFSSIYCSVFTISFLDVPRFLRK
jgi:hypothetical protein